MKITNETIEGKNTTHQDQSIIFASFAITKMIVKTPKSPIFFILPLA